VVVAVVSIYAAYRMLVNKPSHKTTLRTEHAKEHPHAKSTKPEKHWEAHWTQFIDSLSKSFFSLYSSSLTEDRKI